MIRGHGQVTFLISTLDKVVQADGQAQVVEAVSEVPFSPPLSMEQRFVVLTFPSFERERERDKCCHVGKEEGESWSRKKCTAVMMFHMLWVSRHCFCKMGLSNCATRRIHARERTCCATLRRWKSPWYVLIA